MRLFGRITYGIVNQWDLIVVESKERTDGFAVHRTTWNCAQPGCRTEEVDVFANDARINSNHPLGVLIVAAEFVHVCHHEKHNWSILDKILSGCHDATMVT